jgi:hypothetical protein
MSSGIKNIVLVHGNFADGSGWEGVFQILQRDGYNVTIVQNPTLSLAQDVALTKHAIASAPGDVILAGHSYGGVVVTEGSRKNSRQTAPPSKQLIIDADSGAGANKGGAMSRRWITAATAQPSNRACPPKLKSRSYVLVFIAEAIRAWRNPPCPTIRRHL